MVGLVLQGELGLAFRIEVRHKHADTRSRVLQNHLKSIGFSTVSDVKLADVYSIDADLNPVQLQSIASMLTNPVVQESKVGAFLDWPRFDWAIEIGFLPGVTDNAATTVREGIQDRLNISFNQNKGVYSSQLFLVSGTLSQNQISLLAKELYNPIIQRMHIVSFDSFVQNNGMPIVIPKVELHSNPIAQTIEILFATDEELKQTGKLGIADSDGSRRGPLALDLDSMKTIQAYFKKRGRNPTDVELESIAQTWSEHCKHTIFANPLDEITDGLFKTYIRGATEHIRKQKGAADFCVSVFSDNAGAIAFDENHLVTHKVETHNSPSALDPFGGAITGIVGVNRDCIGFGLGAKPVANTYGFCFADPDDTKPLYRDAQGTSVLLLPRRIMTGVIDGVKAGGNCSGIPTPQGFVYFDSRFKGKPLVFVGTVGLIPRQSNQRLLHEKKARPNDLIVMVGGRVGQDGIHGATFSSEAMDSKSPATAVQIGDPITQKKLSDALVKEARDLQLYSSITDNGAGGLSCSVAEMARESNGCCVELEKVPLKYPGLEPWKIWVSESQERMTLALAPKNWSAFSDLMKRRGVEASVIGTFTNSGKCTVTFHGQTVLDLELDFLHNGLPKRYLQSEYPKKIHPEPDFAMPTDLTIVLHSMVSRLNHSSTEFISQQFDHEVQAGSVLKPLQGSGRVNADATVTRPVLESSKAIVLSQALNPSYSDIDTYHMAACAIDTAVRNCVAAGASSDQIALLDNFCWCSSNDAFRLGQLKAAVAACFDTAVAFQTPFISGKDSMFNDFKGFDENKQPVLISVPPTLLVSSIAVMDDALQAVSMDAKIPGDLVYLLGETNDELGASEYFALMGEQQNGKTFIGNNVPKVDLEQNKKLYHSFHECIQNGLIASAVSMHRGGLGVALVRTAMAGGLGLDVSLENLRGNSSRTDFALFSESQGRILTTVAPENKKQFENLLQGHFSFLGMVQENNQFRIKDKTGQLVVNTTTNELLNSYRERFKDW